MNKKRSIIKNGKSYHVTVPQSIVQVFNITNEDKVKWRYDKENDCFIIKLIKN